MRVGITFSAFDLLHAGHIAMLREAKEQCDYLVAGLQLDPTIDRPVYTMSTLGAQYQIQVFTPTLIDGTTPQEEGIVSANLIRVPSKAEWGYVVVNERALYSAGRATNFELHPSEETNLVNKILELAGIILNKPGLVQIADQEDIKRIQQQKM